ncbi:MAG: hypothetical protein ACRER1_04715, partial [Gammaproteobacteria bacterium]
MISIRSLARIALAAGALALAFPALAGSLSPQLRALADSYRKAPQTTVTRATTGRAPGIFQPHISAAGTVQVYIHYRPGGLPTAAALARVNARKVLISRPLGVVQAWVPITKLEATAALDGVIKVSLPVYGMVKGSAGFNPATDTCSAVQAGLNIDNEGITAQRVAPLHQDGITGAGVKVGVISDGADCISVSQTAGYLPNNVWINPSLAGSGDEGTAMMEEVHAMAPDAALGFCGPGTTADFLQCLDDFATWGANVISDDLGFFPLAFTTDFENGITSFAQNNPTISLTTSAGNSRAGFFQDDYTGTASPSSPGVSSITLSPTYTPANGGAAGRTYQSAMIFNAGGPDAAEKVTLGDGNRLFADLVWDDPLNGPYDDLDLFLLKSDGTIACTPTSDHFCNSNFDQKDNPGNPGANNWYPPGEFINYTNNTGSTQTLYLVVFCFDCSAHGASPLHIKLYGHMNGGGNFHYVTNGGVGGHAALAAEFTTAAAYHSGFGANSTIESFSDTGPFTYGDWVNGTQTR